MLSNKMVKLVGLGCVACGVYICKTIKDRLNKNKENDQLISILNAFNIDIDEFMTNPDYELPLELAERIEKEYMRRNYGKSLFESISKKIK